MTLDDLRAHAWAYYTAPMIGADVQLRRWLGLARDFPVPLSISHGVELGQFHFPQDVTAPEPLHWSYNDIISTRAAAYKPVIEMPHPLLMEIESVELPAGRGQLVVGPPPGPENDRNLLALIADRAGPDSRMLVKPRGHWRPSADFWAANGFAPVTASPGADGYFGPLVQLIAAAETVVGATFSSVLVFAAALGRRVELVPGFTHRTLEGASYLDEVDIDSPAMRAVVATFLSGNQQAIGVLARRLLGWHLLGQRAAKAEELRQALHRLRAPVWLDPAIRFPPARLRYWLARATRRPGLFNAGMGQLAARVRRRDLAVMEIDEFDLWANGPNDRNFRLTPLADRGERRRAGAALDGYPQ